MGTMRYKPSDKVRIKSLDWYNENKNKFGKVWTSGGQIPFDKYMSKWCDKVMTISDVRADHYTMIEDLRGYWTDEMIEGLVEEETKTKFKVGDKVITNKGYIGKFEGWVSDYQVRVLFEESGCDVVIHPKDLKLMEEETKPNIIEEAKTYWDSIKDAWICPEGYIFKDENGNVINATKIVLNKKKNKYPKTYEECCKILGCKANHFFTDFSYNGCDVEISDYEDKIDDLLQTFRKLRYCRDAYWKIAGDEMGLGKPWKPDWNTSEPKYVIACTSNEIEKQWETTYRKGFAFPTSEMRDAFYENFKEEIEKCKELL